MIILSPVLTYANKTTHHNYRIFHNETLAPLFFATLDQATEDLKLSEFYNPTQQIDICLNDGSIYPQLIQLLRGQAFAWGFYNKVVLQGKANYTGNYVELNNYKWNLKQLLTHEMTHCLQFDNLGLWKSNPVAKIPNWKWEGYAEYVARQNNDQKDLSNNITRVVHDNNPDWEIVLADNTIVSKDYYKNWILVQYCLNIRGMNYQQLLSDTTSEQSIKKEMMNWFENTNKKNL
jgi:uncharacterized protein YjaZ